MVFLMLSQHLWATSKTPFNTFSLVAPSIQTFPRLPQTAVWSQPRQNFWTQPKPRSWEPRLSLTSISNRRWLRFLSWHSIHLHIRDASVMRRHQIHTKRGITGRKAKHMRKSLWCGGKGWKSWRRLWSKEISLGLTYKEPSMILRKGSQRSSLSSQNIPRSYLRRIVPSSSKSPSRTSCSPKNQRN